MKTGTTIRSALRAMFAAPARTVDDEAFATVLVRQVLLGLLILASAGTVVVAVIGETERIPTTLALAAVALTVLALRPRLGAARAASALVVGLVVFVTVALVQFGGLGDPASVLYVLPVVLAGVTLGGRAVAVTTSIVLVCVGGLSALERLDVLTDDGPVSRNVVLINRVGLILALAGILIISLRSRDRAESQRRDAERAREATRAFYEGVIANSPVAITVADVATDGRVFASPEFTRVTGLTSEQLATMTAEDRAELVHPDDRDRLAEDRQLFTDSDGHQGTKSTFRYRTVDGWRWYDARLAVLDRNPDGSIARVVTSGIDVTERVEADAQRHTLLDAAPVMVTISDYATGERSYVSPEFTRYTGFDREAFTAMSDEERRGLVHPDDRPSLEEALARFRATDGAEGREVAYRYRTVHGYRWILTQAKVLSRTPDGEIDQLMVTGFDISRERAAETFRATALANSLAMVSIYDLRRQHLEFVNDAFADATGYTAESLVGLAEADLRGRFGDDADAVDAAISETIASGEAQDLRHRFRYADGTEHTWITRVAVFAGGPDGEDPKLHQSSVDITQLVEAQALTETILESSPALTVLFDAEKDETVYTSRSFTAATGHTAEYLNAIGVEARRALTPEPERSLVDAAIQAALETGEVQTVERTYRGMDGELRWHDARFVRLPPPRDTNLVIAASDITERKTVELALEAERAQLARANRDLQDFVYIASHDLQEPLRTVSAFTELLTEELPDDLSEEATTALRFVNEGATRMRALVADLLEHSRIGAHRRVTAVDTAEIVHEIVDDLHDLIERETATVEIGDLPVVRGDRTDLRLLFQNLVVNAIKFHAEDRLPTVRIDGEAAPDGGWRFTVADNGIGIADHHVDRIFAIFQRLHPREAYDGTGIGLAHAKRVVESHGGEIGLDSEPGVGSTFWFRIAQDGEP